MSNSVNKFSIIFNVLLVLFLSAAYHSYELNDKCELKTGAEGVCLHFDSCQSAKRYLSSGIFPVLCGHEYVCCEISAATTEGPVINSDSESKSELLDSKMLESTNCLAACFNSKATSENEPEFLYETEEISDKSVNFVAKVGIRELNGDTFYYCGGVLLTPNFVLTPAHCTRYRGKTPELVLLQNHKTNEAQKIPISKIHTHSEYSNTMYNDIALLELVISSNLLPACVWRWEEDDLLANTSIIALGNDLVNVGQLQSMTVELKSNEHCNNLYMHMNKLPLGMMDSQFCLANSNITEAQVCKGFIGSPLLARNAAGNEFTLIGLATYVQQCYSMTYPMIYTKLLSYKEWLESIIY